MPGSQLFSVGVDNLLQEIRPYGQPESIFPQRYIAADGRRVSGEATHAWFRRLVDAYCDGDPKRSSIEDNIAVFLKLTWRHRTELHFASIQTLVTPCDLDDYYLECPADEAIYLRLDFDYGTLGTPFSHPLAHIQIDDDRWPRFALDGGVSGNIVIDYLEFIYRHCVPLKWRKWAEGVWRRASIGSDDDEWMNPFANLMDAFESNQFDYLTSHADLLARVKLVLRQRKDELFPFHMAGADREILEYPLAR